MFVTDGVPYMDQIDLSENYLYSIGPCAKKKKMKKQFHKNVSMNVIS